MTSHNLVNTCLSYKIQKIILWNYKTLNAENKRIFFDKFLTNNSNLKIPVHVDDFHSGSTLSELDFRPSMGQISSNTHRTNFFLTLEQIMRLESFYCFLYIAWYPALAFLTLLVISTLLNTLSDALTSMQFVPCGIIFLLFSSCIWLAPYEACT